jgi:hypothetical protein
MGALGTACRATLQRQRLDWQAAEKDCYASLRSMAWFHGRPFSRQTDFLHEQGSISSELALDDLIAAVE